MGQGHAVLGGRRAIVISGPDLGRALSMRLRQAGAEVADLHWDAGAGIDPDSPAMIGGLVGEAAKRLGDVDVLVVDLLPTVAPCPLDAMSTDAMTAALGRVAGTAAAMNAAHDALCRSDHARIIVIGHRYGQGVAEGIAPYNAAAWALVGVVRSAALDWGRHGIATTLLLPGAATAVFDAARAERPALMDALVAQLPLGRMGDPVADIGGAVVTLAGDAGRFVNGQTIHADGGRHIAGAVIYPIRLARSR